ncbi:MAG: hypothetical protein ACYSUL_12690, partial [Planctomycetota bacterium]
LELSVANAKQNKRVTEFQEEEEENEYVDEMKDFDPEKGPLDSEELKMLAEMARKLSKTSQNK